MAVRKAAQAVLDARAPLVRPLGASTLADLYDPLAMPAALMRAHVNLDRAVDRCYRADRFRTDRERLEHLFGVFERLTAPLLPVSQRRRRRRAAATQNHRVKRR